MYAAEQCRQPSKYTPFLDKGRGIESTFRELTFQFGIRVECGGFVDGLHNLSNMGGKFRKMRYGNKFFPLLCPGMRNSGGSHEKKT